MKTQVCVHKDKEWFGGIWVCSNCRERISQKDAAHSPGPWIAKKTAVYDAVYDANGDLVCFVSIRDPKEIQANVRLIARLPELLANSTPSEEA